MTKLPPINANEIEWLMSHEPGAAAPPPSAPTPETVAAPTIHAPQPTVARADAEELLRQAELAIQSMHAARDADLPAGAAPYRLEELSDAGVSTEAANLDLIRDVELSLKIELGRTQMSLEDVLKLRHGAVVPLDKQAGEPVDVYANGRLIARGEVVVLDDSFCVRVVELVAAVGEAA